MAPEGLDALDYLSKAWYNLRVSVRCPSRVPTWDAIILTAASPQQAQLYQWHLDRAKWQKTIASSTIVLTVPDPQGCRIGSGGATLSALRVLADHLYQNSSEAKAPGPCNGELPNNSEVFRHMLDMCILLVHAGGDSRRIPWANPMGKAFLPLPFLSNDDPDGPVPSLFDHILAISSTAVPHVKSSGGLFIMTGDVLPCFDFSTLHLPDHGACVITVPVALDVAVNHGVIVTSSVSEKVDFVQGVSCLGQKRLEFELVVNLLQKPSAKQLKNAGALTAEGAAMLDTGIFVVTGKAWRDLASLALEDPNPVLELLTNEEEVSLYEELAGSWVAARHEWLEKRPLGKKLITALSVQRLYSYCARDMLFLHFGTSIELLNHLAKDHGGRVGRRHLDYVAKNSSCDLAPSAVILSSEIDGVVSVGEHSLVFDCTLYDEVFIGSQCITIGAHFDQRTKAGGIFQAFENIPIVIPDRHCLWEVPLFGTESRVTLCCGVEDNPKSSLAEGGTFCGKPWGKFLIVKGFREEELWPFLNKEKHNLWNASLFPVLPPGQGMFFVMWLMGNYNEHSSYFLRLWHTCERVSLAELHTRIDFKRLCHECSSHRSKLALRLMKASLVCGLFERNFSRLSAEIIHGDSSGTKSCKELLSLCPNPKVGGQNLETKQVPSSRIYQAQVDLHRVCGEDMASVVSEDDVWQAVAAETAAAVGHRSAVESLSSLSLNNKCLKFPVLKSRVELPVRIDVVGGWSDTPPWSLERVGTVLNMALCLEGARPVGAEIIVTLGPGISIRDDTGNHLHIEDLNSIATPFQVNDAFRLVKSALLVSGIATMSSTWRDGLEIRTWANVPRGSGLGTSSILAAAVVKGLLQIMGRDDSNKNVASLVLLLEQLMGTGGGWQDQIGGLYPGIKCTSSFPGQPLKLTVEPVQITLDLKNQLEERMMVVFTGQVRLAHQVLENVVRRYLQHDTLLISTIKRLVQLAHLSQETLIAGNLKKLGRIMSEAWMLHQELDPNCSNVFVDRLFTEVAELTDGYKLVGAGGGGFALLMAKHRDAALSIKEMLENLPVKVYNWSLCE